MEHFNQQQHVERNAFRALRESEAVRMTCAQAALRSITNTESHACQRMLELENQQSMLHLEMTEQSSHEATLALEVKQASALAQLHQRQLQNNEPESQLQLRSFEQRMIAYSKRFAPK